MYLCARGIDLARLYGFSIIFCPSLRVFYYILPVSTVFLLYFARLDVFSIIF